MITNRDLKYFNVAKSVSQLSDFRRCHIGCVVVYRKNIISTGFNSTKTHTLQYVYNHLRFDVNEKAIHSVHAEIDALSKIRYLDIEWNKVNVYVYRGRKNDGSPMLAKPCVSCRAYMKKLGVRNIYYSDYDSYGYMKLEGE